MKTIRYEDAMNLIDGSSDEYEFIKKIEGESGRWNQNVQIIFKSGNNYYGFDYSQGLTEMQENTINTVEHYDVELYSEAYSDDKVEVYPVKKVAITSYEYVPIKEN